MTTPKSSPRKPPLSNSPLRSQRPTFASISGSGAGYDDIAPPSASGSTARDVEEEEEEVDELQSEEEEPAPRPHGRRNDGGGGGRNVKCKWVDCGQILPDQETLVTHLQEEHFQPGKDSYSCQWDGCARKGARQATRHSLVTHVRAHTGERPYTCPQPGCGSTFTRSDAMSKHLRTLHSLPLEETNGRARKARAGRSVFAEMDSHSHGGHGHAHSHAQYPPAPGSITSQAIDGGASELAMSEVGEGDGGDGTYKPGKKSKGGAGKGKGRASLGAGRGRGKGKGRGGSGVGGGRAASPGVTPLSRADQDLLEDEDMEGVLHRIRYRTHFWSTTVDDLRAVESVRASHPRKPVTDLADDEEDSFDEGITAGANPGVVAVVKDDRAEDVEVMGRSKWQTRYIMAKVKLMLVEEENMMRKTVLEKLMAHQIKLEDEIEKVTFDNAL